MPVGFLSDEQAAAYGQFHGRYTFTPTAGSDLRPLRDPTDPAGDDAASPAG